MFFSVQSSPSLFVLLFCFLLLLLLLLSCQVLVYDKAGQDVLAPLLSVKELNEQGVTLFRLLGSQRDPLPGTSTSMSVGVWGCLCVVTFVFVSVCGCVCACVCVCVSVSASLSVSVAVAVAASFFASLPMCPVSLAAQCGCAHSPSLCAGLWLTRCSSNLLLQSHSGKHQTHLRRSQRAMLWSGPCQLLCCCCCCCCNCGLPFRAFTAPAWLRSVSDSVVFSQKPMSSTSSPPFRGFFWKSWQKQLWTRATPPRSPKSMTWSVACVLPFLFLQLVLQHSQHTRTLITACLRMCLCLCMWLESPSVHKTCMMNAVFRLQSIGGRLFHTDGRRRPFPVVPALE